MPSAGVLRTEQGKIKLRDNDDDKNNICAIKDPATANVPQPSPKVKVNCESSRRRRRDCVVYLSVAGAVLILCSSVLFMGLWWYRTTGGKDTRTGEDLAAVFRRHLTSDDSVEQIRRITRSVILEEMPSLLYAVDRESGLMR